MSSTLFNIITNYIQNRHKKTKDVNQCLNDDLPSFIQDAETSGFASGKDKMNYVKRLAISRLTTITKESWEKVSNKYSDLIESKVEKLLAIPQATIYKKEKN